MTLIIISLILTIIANAVLGLMVLLRTYQRSYGRYFAVTVFGVALWALGDLLLLGAKSPGLAHFGAEIFYVVPTVIPMAILLFSLAYPDNHQLRRHLVSFMTVVFIGWAFLYAYAFSFFIKNIQIISNGPNHVYAQEPGFLMYAAHFSLFFIATYYVLYKKFLRLRGLARTQITYTLYGVATASLLAMVTNLSLPIMGNTNYIWLGPVLTLTFVAVVSYSIIRHQLFDIRLVIARSLAYIFSLTTLVIAYAIVVTTVSTALTRVVANTGVIKDVVTIALLALSALTYGPIKHYFDRVSNKLFYRDAYDSQHFLDELNKVLVSSLDVDYLLTKSSAVIREQLKAEYCTFGLKDTDSDGRRFIGDVQHFKPRDVEILVKKTKQLQQSIMVTDYLDKSEGEYSTTLRRNNIAMIIRLVSGSDQTKTALGYLILGPKKSGNPYNSNDNKVLQIIANELVIAIQNALQFEQIQRFNITLQQKVDEATRKYRNANKRLTELDETKDDFISMASHQLRTPLTSVKGYLSMVLEEDAGKINDVQRKMLGQAFTSSQRMVYLIADLLNVSRLKTGKFIIEAVPLNLSQLVSDELAQLQETAASRSLKLVFNPPAEFPELMLDETKTRQVIMNFVDNAIYYTPAGGTITIELLEKPAVVELRVVDTGIGVPKSEQHHLFTKFYRAGNARKARPDGTGLGLFMAKKVVIAQGGAIVFASQEGQGSVFGFTFSKTKLGVKTTNQAQKAITTAVK